MKEQILKFIQHSDGTRENMLVKRVKSSAGYSASNSALYSTIFGLFPNTTPAAGVTHRVEFVADVMLGYPPLTN